MNELTQSEQAAFFRAALFLGLVRGETVVQWADETLARWSDVPAAFVEIASIPAGDLTALRLALLRLCDEREPDRVIRAVLGLVRHQLASGRRSFGDTMTVLKQMRGSIKLAPELADTLRQFELQFLRASRTGEMTPLEVHVHDWLKQHGGSADRPMPDQ